MRSKRVQREIDDLVAQGWRIEEETPDRVVMVDREFGSVGSHIVVALLTFWFSLGVGNVVWAAYNYVSNSRRRVLWEDDDACPACGAAVSATDDYCPSCGDPLETGTDPTGAITCPDCEAVVTDGSRYCPACGAKLSNTVDTAS